MKVLSIFFLLTAFFNTPTETTTLEIEGPSGDLTIAGLHLDFGGCSSTLIWSVIICNNGNSTTGATTAEVGLEFCPLQFEDHVFVVPALRGRTCIRLSGTIEEACPSAFLEATVDPDNLVGETNEENNYDSIFEDC